MKRNALQSAFEMRNMRTKTAQTLQRWPRHQYKDICVEQNDKYSNVDSKRDYVPLFRLFCRGKTKQVHVAQNCHLTLPSKQEKVITDLQRMEEPCAKRGEFIICRSKSPYTIQFCKKLFRFRTSSSKNALESLLLEPYNLFWGTLYVLSYSTTKKIMAVGLVIHSCAAGKPTSRIPSPFMEGIINVWWSKTVLGQLCYWL